MIAITFIAIKNTNTIIMNNSLSEEKKGTSVNFENTRSDIPLFIKGFNKTISHISIGRIQHELKSITNVGFRNNLKILEKFKYLLFNEYDNGLYEYHIY